MTEQPNAIEFDAAFDARVREYIKADDKAFADWLAKDDLEGLINGALDIAKATHRANINMVEEVIPMSTIAMIDLSHRRARPLVQALHNRRIGQTDIWTYSWDISFRDLFWRGHSNSCAQACATIEAFAIALSKPGFELRIHRL